MVENVSPQVAADQTASRLVMLAEVASTVADTTDYANTHSIQRLTQRTTSRKSSEAANSTPLPLPSPPPTPYPWIWRCHECDSEYPLAVTRRCLYCSHHFCTAPPTDIRLKQGLPGERDYCDAEFDYYGWAQWGAYRRSVAAIRASEIARNGAITAVKTSSQDGKGLLKRKRGCDIEPVDQDTFAMFELTTVHSRQNEQDTGRLMWKPLSRSAGKEVSRRKKKMYVSGRYNCWLHCDFPNECVHSIYSAWTQGGVRPCDQQDSPVSQSYKEQETFGNGKDQESQTQEEREKKRKKDVAPPEHSHGSRRSRRLWEKGGKREVDPGEGENIGL